MASEWVGISKTYQTWCAYVLRIIAFTVNVQRHYELSWYCTYISKGSLGFEQKSRKWENEMREKREKAKEKECSLKELDVDSWMDGEACREQGNDVKGRFRPTFRLPFSLDMQNASSTIIVHVVGCTCMVVYLCTSPEKT